MGSSITYTKTTSRIFAVSTETGIFVSASAFPDDEQPMSAFVTRDSDGNIVGKIVNESLASAHDEWKEKNPYQYDFVNKYTKFFQVFFTILIGLITLLKNTNITLFFSIMWVVSLFTGSLYNVSYYCSILIYNKIKMPSIARFHAAEHMAYHVANEFKRVPTLNEISEASMYEYKCATTESLLIPTAVSVIRTICVTVSVFFVGAGFLYLLKTWSDSWEYNFLFVLLVAITACVSKLLVNIPSFVTKRLKKESFFLKIMQWPVVSKPNKDEIEIAQQAIRLHYLMDDTIKEDSEGYKIEDVSFDLLNKKAIYTFCNGKTGRITLLEYINSVVAILNAKIEKNEDDSCESSKEIENADEVSVESADFEESDEVTVQTIYFNDVE